MNEWVNHFLYKFNAIYMTFGYIPLLLFIHKSCNPFILGMGSKIVQNQVKQNKHQ